jgi:CheY-like chemotaxis protein
LNPDMKPGAYACLTIVDSGRGMDKTLMEKIFDPFFTTKSNGKGTGMGLSVIHGIVRSLKGDIQVFSRIEKGSEFMVYIPLEKSFPEKEKALDKAPAKAGVEQLMIVDDEKEIVLMEKQFLERLGYQVSAYTDSTKALEAFRLTPDKFDLIITDMAMPRIPGDKLSAELIKIRPDIPILICTGFSDYISEKKAASLGIKGFLMKPVVTRDLSDKICEILDDAKKAHD